MIKTVDEVRSEKAQYGRVACLIGVIFIAICIVSQFPRISQDNSYHNFSDSMMRWGIENASNVISNLSFMIAGFVGLVRIRCWSWSQRTFMWRFFFCSIIVVGLGSGYYHLQPSNDTLVWDRLPMTLGFASLMACICAERFNLRVGSWLFGPLVLSGILSVLYWSITEQVGAGDLRPYIIVQYVPMLIVPLILILFPKTSKVDRYYWILLSGYMIAKGVEMQDRYIFEMTHYMISGHTLKHIIAGVGILLFQPEHIIDETE